jgi:hypothetical protein
MDSGSLKEMLYIDGEARADHDRYGAWLGAGIV